MNAGELAKQAELSSVAFRGTVSDGIVHKIELAYVAQWLYDQDDSVTEKATVTALNAITQLNGNFARRQVETSPVRERPRG